MSDIVQSTAKGPEIISMGCRLNIAEGEAMRALLAGRDDVVVINSCAVTNEAVRQTRQAIRKARKARPGAQLVVTGCAAQTDPAMFAAMPEVDRVLGNVEKLSSGKYPLPFVPSNRDAPLPFVPSPSTPPVGALRINFSLWLKSRDVRARAAKRPSTSLGNSEMLVIG